MNEFYRSFIDAGKELAAKKGLHWDLPCSASGKVDKADRWNLTLLCGLAPPPTIWLSDLGYDASSVEALNRLQAEQGLPPIVDTALPLDWREFLQAVVLNELLVKRNKPGHAIKNIGRHIRILATCAGETSPWGLTPDIVQRAYNVALQVGESGKLAANLSMVVRTVIDGLHLADRSPLGRFCIPYPTDVAKAAEIRVQKLRRNESTCHRTDRMRTELSQRKGAAKLPEEKAFWELVRIVFMEQPQTFSDAIRFTQVRLAIVTGFRVGENTMVPADWERWREYVDAEGLSAGKKGGISRSLMIRHFAEKQVEDEGEHGIVLYETAQHVPPMFQETVLESLGYAERITAPMRARLRRQIETGRLLPEFEPSDLVEAWDLYTRVAGSIRFVDAPLPETLVAQYRADHDPDVLERIRDWQIERLHREGLYRRVRNYWGEWADKAGLTIRRNTGAPIAGTRLDWSQAYLRVGEVEEMIRAHMPTKLPDLDAFTLADGQKLHASDLLFLMPVRALVENRNGGIIDMNRYFATGRVDTLDLQGHLGGKDDNLFSRYGETTEDRAYKLNTHSLRHLQNAELFRLGVADTIITKRFNRRSVAQSHEYDHRSLAEDLAHIDLPAEAERMGPRAQEALRMIQARRVSGPIVEEFLRIQQEQGDDTAFDYLEAEADGLHVTPYGFCLNSFTVDPCPKHLECFNGCRHLTRSEAAEEQRNLVQLRDRMARVVAKIEDTPVTTRTVGWQNQLAHAHARLANIEKALAALPGQTVFPDGPDLYRSFQDATGTSILDTKPKIRRAE